MQELSGTVTDLSWDADGKQLSLTAACHLAARTALTPALLAARADPTYLLNMHGPSALAWAQQHPSSKQAAHLSTQSGSTQHADISLHHLNRTHDGSDTQMQGIGSQPTPADRHQGKPDSNAGHGQSKQHNATHVVNDQDKQPEGNLNSVHAQGAAAQHQQTCETSSMPWQASDAPTFELCLEPSYDDVDREHKLQLLHASALGTSHFLTMQSSQVCLSLCCFLNELRAAPQTGASDCPW